MGGKYLKGSRKINETTLLILLLQKKRSWLLWLPLGGEVKMWGVKVVGEQR